MKRHFVYGLGINDSDMSSQRNVINITEKKHRYIQTSIYMIYSVMLYVTSIFKVFFNFIF